MEVPQRKMCRVLGKTLALEFLSNGKRVSMRRKTSHTEQLTTCDQTQPLEKRRAVRAAVAALAVVAAPVPSCLVSVCRQEWWVLLQSDSGWVRPTAPAAAHRRNKIPAAQQRGLAGERRPDRRPLVD